MTEDEKYMRRCLALAYNGRYGAAPNPMVGAVIVCNGRIIGEGYHIRCGGPHAEVNAVRSVRNPELLGKSVIYVSFEPCSHYGKTPPCADLIIEKQIPRVVVGCVDPFAKVAGRGIQKLRNAGIDVKTGVLEEECRALNRRFITFHSEKRPYVVLKWAQSADGFIDVSRTGGSPAVLSSAETLMLAHRHRAGCKAVLVGRRTALLDNPNLTVRSWWGENPLRLVVDRTVSLPASLHLFDGTVPTVVFTEKERENSGGVEYCKLDFSSNILPQIMSCLYRRGVQSLLVEGGHELLQGFIDSDLWDEAYIERSACFLSGGVPAPALSMAGHVGLFKKRWGVDYLHFMRIGKQKSLSEAV